MWASTANPRDPAQEEEGGGLGEKSLPISHPYDAWSLSTRKMVTNEASKQERVLDGVWLIGKERGDQDGH